ncbi:MAG: RHS repeat domain-containing protein [Chlamydiia bacterium]
MKKFIFILLSINIALCASSYVDSRIAENGKLMSIDLKQLGSIDYEYEGLLLKKIHRKNFDGNVLYTHEYIYDERGYLSKELLIGNAGIVEYKISDKFFSIHAPYYVEYTRIKNIKLLAKKIATMQKQKPSLIAQHNISKFENKIFNRRGQLSVVVDEKELTQLVYNKMGLLDQVFKGEKEVSFNYDEKGVRTSKYFFENEEQKTLEKYWNFGINDIVVLDQENQVKWVRIPGLTTHKDSLRSVAIEIKDEIFAPIHNFQGDIVRLISLRDGQVIHTEPSNSFGDAPVDEPIIPWLYREKHYDVETGFVNFGARHYSPYMRRWISPDPLGDLQSSDLYQYCFNRPDLFYDPDGRFVIVIPLVWMGGVALAETLAYSAFVASVGYFGYKIVGDLNDRIHTPDTYDPYGNGLVALPPYLPHNYIDNWQQYDALNRGGQEGRVDETLPVDPHNHPDWEDISHPEGVKKGKYKFRDKETGHEIEYHLGNPDQPGHRKHDHYHRINPNSTKGNRDKYLDEKGNPVGKNSPESHLYRPEKKWWEWVFRTEHEFSPKNWNQPHYEV